MVDGNAIEEVGDVALLRGKCHTSPVRSVEKWIRDERVRLLLSFALLLGIALLLHALGAHGLPHEGPGWLTD